MREIGSGRRKEGRQKEMTPYIIVFMISIGLFALSDRVIFTQRKPVVFVAVITLCLLAGLRAESIGTDTRVYLVPIFEAAKKCHSLGEYLNSSFYMDNGLCERYGTFISAVSFDCDKNYGLIVLRPNHFGIVCDFATIYRC